MTKLKRCKIAVVSTNIIVCPPPAYSGLEMIAWQQARGLAHRGHDVILIAPKGSKPPDGVRLWETVLGQPEQDSCPDYADMLATMGVIMDHSVAGDQEMLVRVEGQPRWLSFDRLFNLYLSRSPALLEDGRVVLQTRGLQVLSMTDDLGLRWTDVATIVRHPNCEEIRTVHTTRGFECRMTPGHGLFAAGAESPEVIPVSMSQGRVVAAMKRVPPLGAAPTEMLPGDPRFCDLLAAGAEVARIVQDDAALILERLRGKCRSTASLNRRIYAWRHGGAIPSELLRCLPQECVLEGRGPGRQVRWPVPLTDDLLTALGLWVGDGSYDKASVKWASGAETFDVIGRAALLFGAKAIPCSVRPDVDVAVNSVVMKRLMQIAGFTGDSHTKQVPDWVFGLPPSQIGAFLRGWFSSDGYAGKAGSLPRLSSVNRRLLEQAQMLLAMLGISAPMAKSSSRGGFSGKNAKPMWELRFDPPAYHDFVEHVGFVEPRRNASLLSRATDRASWAGDVPFFVVRERSPRSDAVQNVRNKRVSEAVGVRLDTAWVKVKAVTPTGERPKYVYDLCVPGPENFVAGGVVCHNSWEKWSYFLKMRQVVKCPVIGTLHAPVEFMYQTPPPVPFPCLVAISKDQASAAMGRWGVAVRVCYNGCDPDFYKPMPLERGDRYLFLGRMSIEKGPHIAVDVAKRTGVQLDIVGDDKLIASPGLVHRIRGQAVGNVAYIGPVDREKTLEFFSTRKALLHMNKDFREPFGLAPVEAQLCGCPVIAWDNGAMRETVKHGETGFIVQSQDEVEKLVRENAVSTIKPERCREWASQFSVQAMTDRCEELIAEALDTGGW